MLKSVLEKEELNMFATDIKTCHKIMTNLFLVKLIFVLNNFQFMFKLYCGIQIFYGSFIYISLLKLQYLIIRYISKIGIAVIFNKNEIWLKI